MPSTSSKQGAEEGAAAGAAEGAAAGASRGEESEGRGEESPESPTVVVFKQSSMSL